MKFVIYRDKQNFFRWRFVAANGKITADSGEGYSSKTNVKRAIRRIVDQMVNFSIEIIEK